MSSACASPFRSAHDLVEYASFRVSPTVAFASDEAGQMSLTTHSPSPPPLFGVAAHHQTHHPHHPHNLMTHSYAVRVHGSTDDSLVGGSTDGASRIPHDHSHSLLGSLGLCDLDSFASFAGTTPRHSPRHGADVRIHVHDHEDDERDRESRDVTVPAGVLPSSPRESSADRVRPSLSPNHPLEAGRDDHSNPMLAWSTHSTADVISSTAVVSALEGSAAAASLNGETRSPPLDADLEHAWRTLAATPALHTAARQHVQQLDAVMKRTCAIILEGVSSSTAAAADSTSPIDRHLQRIGELFGRTRAQVIRMYMQRASDESRSSVDVISMPLVRSTSDLLYEEQAAADPLATGATNQTTGVAARTASVTTADAQMHSPPAVLRLHRGAGEEGDSTHESMRHAIDPSPHVVHVKREIIDSTLATLAEDAIKSETDHVKSKRAKKPRKQGAKSTGKKKKDSESFNPAAVSILRRWLQAHLDDPYPDARTKISLAEVTKLSYEQVQHWFINARMRYWRPLLRRQQALLSSGLNPEDLPLPDGSLVSSGSSTAGSAAADTRAAASSSSDSASLSDLVSVAASATPSSVGGVTHRSSTSAACMPDMQEGLSHGIGLGFGSPAAGGGSPHHAELALLVPRSGRSYMCLDGGSAAATTSGSADALRGTIPRIASESSVVSVAAAAPPPSAAATRADLLAASTLALHIAANYQTPHSYITSHPLHRGHKYKSGGKRIRHEEDAETTATDAPEGAGARLAFKSAKRDGRSSSRRWRTR